MHKKTLQAQNRDSKNRGRRSGSKTRDQRFALSFRLTRFLLYSLLRTRPCVTTGFLRHQNASIAHYTMRSTLRASSENLSAPSNLSKPHFKRVQIASITTNVRSTALRGLTPAIKVLMRINTSQLCQWVQLRRYHCLEKNPDPNRTSAATTSCPRSRHAQFVSSASPRRSQQQCVQNLQCNAFMNLANSLLQLHKKQKTARNDSRSGN